MVKRPTNVRRARTALTVTAALAVLAALPGTGWAAPGDGLPAYAFADDAEPVKGTASSGDGPTLKPGTYRDTIKRGQKKYYAVNLDAKTSAWFSAVAAPKPGAKVARYGEGLEISLKTVDGDECGNGPASGEFGGGGHAYPVATGVERHITGEDDACDAKGPYLLSVSRKGSGTSDPAEWPVELSYKEEPPVKGTRPAAPADIGLPEDDEVPVPSVSGGKKQAKGGTGFNDAGAVDSGLWKDRAVPGETRFYRVPVDWGQQVHASVELGSSGRGGKFPQSVYNAVGAVVYNPARAPLDDPAFGDYTKETAALPLLTPRVDYGNRYGDDAPAASAAGWHYLAVTVSPELAQKYFPGGKKVPLTLRVDVKGTAKKAPAYDGDAREAGFGVTDEDRDQAAKGQTAAEAAEGDDSKKLLAFAGIGAGAALLLGLGVWTLVARRRAAATPLAPPPPPPGYGYPQQHQQHQQHQPHQQPQQTQPQQYQQGGWQ
ncbi:hypothetical protein GCM10009801_47450 [Streptomyces albiaxialis]|uniref:Uncharacterized protein n=1 Tax=Streptomyces albiaxialis TaxID=329523 RepID=A0ABP5HSC8_9ACTN